MTKSTSTNSSQKQKAKTNEKKVKKGTYATVSNADRKRIIDHYTDGLDYVSFAESLEVNASTARSIVQVYQKEGRYEKLPRGGCHQQKIIDEEMGEAIEDIVSEDCDITLKEIRQKLEQQFPTHKTPSITTIARFLDAKVFTMKTLVVEPAKRNTEENKEARQVYGNWFTGLPQDHFLVFCDEFGVNAWTRRNRGRAKKGERAVKKVLSSRTQQVNVICAMNQSVGLVHNLKKRGSVTQEVFQRFVRSVSEKYPDKRIVFVLDNASVHNDPCKLAPRHSVKYLPTYSPQLNPTEELINCWKAAIKRQLRERNEELIATVNEPFGKSSRE